jgi:hypothetical protein
MTGVQIKIDYDDKKWVLIPPAGVMAPGKWAKRTAKSWATDLGRKHDANWQSVLEEMLLASSGFPGADRWDARLVHILTPPREAPSVSLTNLLMSMPSEDVANELPAPDDPDLVEHPVVERIELRSGVLATRVVRYTRGQNDDSVRAEMFLTWRGHEQADLTLLTSSYDVGRVLIMRDDVVELARSISLVPLEETVE